MKKENAIFIIIAAAVIILLGFQSFEAQEKQQEKGEDVYKYIETLVSVYNEIEKNYVDEVDREKLFLGALKGMTRELDPHSDIIPPDVLDVFTEDNMGQFGGLGIEISMVDGILTVVVPIPGEPAEKAGLLPEDRILAIDGESTEGISLLEAVNKLRGKVGTPVTISVLHPGASDPVDITIVRAMIKVDSVRGYEKKPDGTWAYMVDPEMKIAYVRLRNFAANTVEEFDEVMKKLLDEEGMKGLVLDLRFNAGGLLHAAIGITDKFVSGGAIVSTKGRNLPAVVNQAHKAGTYPYFPLAVLVNDSSASASEIVAGALQDHKRGIIIGEETYGKGSVQDVIRLQFGDKDIALKLTKARYYLPSGRSIDRDPKTKKGGITPDIVIPYTQEEKIFLYRQFARNSRRKVIERMREDSGTEPPPEKEISPEEKELRQKEEQFKDREMERALNFIRDILLNEKLKEASKSAA